MLTSIGGCRHEMRCRDGKAQLERSGATARPNKGMKQTSVERIGRSQLIPGVRQLEEGAMDRCETKIYYSRELRSQWPWIALAWSSQYPRIFDRDDLLLVQNQPRYHFPEWFTAIHLFHRDGALCLVEKYGYKKHERKRHALDSVLSEKDARFVRSMVETDEVQPPDLLVIMPNGKIRFAEAKGPGDRLSARQLASHAVIAQRFGDPVEVFLVRSAKRGAAEQGDEADEAR